LYPTNGNFPRLRVQALFPCAERIATGWPFRLKGPLSRPLHPPGNCRIIQSSCKNERPVSIGKPHVFIIVSALGLFIFNGATFYSNSIASALSHVIQCVKYLNAGPKKEPHRKAIPQDVMAKMRARIVILPGRERPRAAFPAVWACARKKPRARAGDCAQLLTFCVIVFKVNMKRERTGGSCNI